MKNKIKTREQKAFEILKHSLPIKKVLPANFFISRSNKYNKLFSYLYIKTKKLYEILPKRKNGENPFIHPINILYALKDAKVLNELTYCIALLHDYIEEEVDVYMVKNNLKEDKNGIVILDRYEVKVAKKLEDELLIFCKKNRYDLRNVDVIMKSVKLLTRHKRHFYYRSISGIFNCDDNQVKERVIQVKLADRTHNILSIDSFDEQGKMYQCFKNLFILNNTKKYLLDVYGLKVFTRELYSPTEKLFNKCSKATYDAFLKICCSSSNKGVMKVKYLLQLAFKKFELNRSGLLAITKLDKREAHPMRLFQGVVWKYDARLHHEWKIFDKIKIEELNFCKLFFSDSKFSEKTLHSILNYKDAFALKEVIAYLIYNPKYYISGFLSSELSKKGRMRKRKKNYSIV